MNENVKPMDWNARAADYPLDTGRPSTIFALDLMRRELSEHGAIVDIGCGPGNESIPFSEIFGKVYSVDSSPNMLARLRRECSERGIDNIQTIEAECLEAEVPERCQAAFSCLCPGMFSKEGLDKLESLSDDLCVFIGHLYEEGCPERRIFEAMGVPFRSRFDTLRYLEEFRGDRDIKTARFADFPRRTSAEIVDRCARMSGASEEERRRMEQCAAEMDLEGLPHYNNVIMLYWHVH